MKKNMIVLILLAAFYSNAQNVGIGNTNPAEKLDVAGNINVTGTIKANGVDGTPNQVLMKNNSGVMEWGNMCDFKNFLTYFSGSTFTVPAGVTKIMVELWGGGGGGNYYCGGGGAGYLKLQLPVVAGDVCTIQVGAGGGSANTATATDGGDSFITLNGNTFTAIGGKGAVFVSASRYNPGVGGTGITSPLPKSYIIIPGGTGGIQTKRYGQNSATTFFEITNGGNGGATYNHPDAGGTAGQNISNMTSSSTVITNAAGADGKLPGGGGASGLVSLGASVTAGSGGRGIVIVYY